MAQIWEVLNKELWRTEGRRECSILYHFERENNQDSSCHPTKRANWGEKTNKNPPSIHSSIHPSINLSILHRLPGVRSQGQQPETGSPGFPPPSHFTQLFRGDPELFLGQPGDIAPPACPGSSRWASYQWDMPWTPHQGGVREFKERQPSLRHLRDRWR